MCTCGERERERKYMPGHVCLGQRSVLGTVPQELSTSLFLQQGFSLEPGGSRLS